MQRILNYLPFIRLVNSVADNANLHKIEIQKLNYFIIGLSTNTVF